MNKRSDIKSKSYRLMPMTIISILGLTLLSCATSATDIVRVCESDFATEPIYLDSITLDSLYCYGSADGSLRQTLLTSAARNGIDLIYSETQIENDEERPHTTMDITIRQSPFLDGSRMHVSKSIIATVRDASGKTMWRLAHIEDGPRGFESLYAIRESADDLFSSFSHSLGTHRGQSK